MIRAYLNERLSIVWRGAQSSSGYISEHTCDPLALLAALFRDERMANDPLPVAQRASCASFGRPGLSPS
jgi:hypothetical protein